MSWPTFPTKPPPEVTMKKLILSLAIILSAAALAVPDAQAEIVIGASLGRSDLQDGGVKDDDKGAQFYGGFHFLKVVGVELEYTDFGKFEDNTGGMTDTLEITRADLFVLGILPLGRFELYAKLGYGYWDGEFRAAGGNPQKDDGSDPAYGVGFAVKFARLIAIRVEYEEFEIKGLDDLTMASIGLDIRF
jgi:hypothetical protein